MARGKQTCKILKEIRRQIAEANDIEFITSECRHKGNCLGTCPKCEAEVRYLEQQLRVRTLAGKAVSIAGISATTIALLMPMQTEAQELSDSTTLMKEYTPTATIDTTDTITVKGVVLGEYVTTEDTTNRDILIGAVIKNLRSDTGAFADENGEFSLTACVGDTLVVHYVGYDEKRIVVTADMKNTTIKLIASPSITTGLVAYTPPEIHYLDLNVFDENNNRIDTDDLDIERIWIDEDGEEDFKNLRPRYYDEKHTCRIYWDRDLGLLDDNSTPLKEATLRINADGYESVIVKVKYPKRSAKRTIRLKHK